MNPRTRLYIHVVIGAALAAYGCYWPFAAFDERSLADWGGVLGIVGIATFSEAVAFHVGSVHFVTTSLSFLPFLATIVLFPPEVAVLAIAVTVALSNIYPVRRTFLKSCFNVAQASLASMAGAATYSYLIAKNLPSILAFFALAVVFFGANLSMMSVALGLMRQEPLGRVFRQLAGPKGSSLLFDVLASPIALFMAYLYGEFHFGGLVVVVLPLLLIRYSYDYRLKLQQANADLLRVLVKAIETRDPYTSGHSIRVARLAKLIAQDIGLRDSQVDAIEQAALLHDIGKIDPQYSLVIAKPHDLSAEERDLIKTHASHGAQLLEELSTVAPRTITAVRHHHEKFDGSGYPDGLKGEQIPLASRIIMISDSIDAMLSDRPYRKALPVDYVLTELVRCSGTQFDPTIVKVILEKQSLTRAADAAADTEVADGISPEGYRKQLAPLTA